MAALGAGTYSYLRDPGSALRPIRLAPPTGAPLPLVSCIMASRGLPFPAEHAIACFRRQTYPRRELIVATAAADDRLAALLAGLADPGIRLVRVAEPAKAGALRNAAIAASGGDLLCVWDDDDLSHPERIALQVGRLHAAGAAACFLARLLLWWPARRRVAVSGARIWENSMLAERSALPRYAEDLIQGEDTLLVNQLMETRRLVLADVPEAYCYVAHGSNLVGDAHFEMLLAGATRSFEGPEHDAVIAARAEAMPFAAYARGLGAD